MRRFGVVKRARFMAWPTGHLPVAVGIAGVVGLLVCLLVFAAPPPFPRGWSLEWLVFVVGVFFTYRQLQTAREGQITERYTRAIDQLAHSELNVRVGAIYALERIARDSPVDRPTIAEVLTAFVRSHSPWPPKLPGQYVATAPLDDVPDLAVRAPDVQTCLTVLDRGGFASTVRTGLNLGAVDLRRATLYGARLEGVNGGRSSLRAVTALKDRSG